jgi:hypothetical protein
MRMLASRSAVRALLAVALLLAPIGAWTAVPWASSTQARAERVAALAVPGGEQVVQADRQPLLHAPADRRGGPGRSRAALLAVLMGTALAGVARRRWGRRDPIRRRPRRGVTPAHPSRAPPVLRIA